MSDESVTKAKGEAAIARARLHATAQELQSRLNPNSLFDNAVSDVHERSVHAVRMTGDAIRERPAAFGAAAAFGALLVVHRPLWRFARRLFGRGHETEPRDAS